jgi:excinuclease ABC subunit A
MTRLLPLPWTVQVSTSKHIVMAATTEPRRGQIVIRGARTHNLKNVDLTIPSRSLVVMTGVSGSGKSSLAFDTIYAEGQRRYVESLSAYARQFLERMEKPDVDAIEGICPAIAIRQKNSIRNPRSTVGTTTEIHDYLRLLYARVGRTFCRNCGREVVRETAEVVARELAELPEGTRLLVGFEMPVIATEPLATSGEVAEGDEDDVSDDSTEDAAVPQPQLPDLMDPVAETLASLRRKGFGRLLIDGQTVSLEDVDPAAVRDLGSLQVIVDRIKVDPDVRTRLTDSIETAYAEGGGAAFAIEVGADGLAGVRREFSERFECRPCGIQYEVPQPRLFSFNNPFGACPICHGFGNVIELDMDLVVPDRSKSIQQNAIEPWSKPHYRAQLADLKRAAKARSVRLDVPWSELSDEEKRFVIEGNGADYEGV